MIKTKRYKLELIANTLRQDVISMLAHAGSGHSAGPLGLADFFSVLYFHILRHKPKEPLWEKRDRFILSCGHVCPILYVTLARSKYFSLKTLHSLRTLGSPLQGHPHRGSARGIETTSGPLGQGFSVAVGMAIAARMDKTSHRIYCLTSDGEQNEGQVWEAAMFAGVKGLANLTLFIDRNNIQIDGTTDAVMPLEPLADKYRSFGWHVIDCDGHDMDAIDDACAEAKKKRLKPTVIILHTTPGKGVRFMEHNYIWHGIPPTQEQARQALLELKEARKKLSGKSLATKLLSYVS
ncbi:transketolase [Candidatus Uhrbacteria bacterium]|nr:transketolase [Candidatus Uhrbacteria bacterium]